MLGAAQPMMLEVTLGEVELVNKVSDKLLVRFLSHSCNLLPGRTHTLSYPHDKTLLEHFDDGDKIHTSNYDVRKLGMSCKEGFYRSFVCVSSGVKPFT